MVTGIETAGIALAVFPLLISGLQSYADGVRTIKELWNPHLALKSLIRELAMEKCKFEITCTSLLEGMVTDADLTILMESPGGSPWKNPDLQEKLDSRLSPYTLACYMAAMKELESTLRILQDSLGLYGDDTVLPLQVCNPQLWLKKILISSVTAQTLWKKSAQEKIKEDDDCFFEGGAQGTTTEHRQNKFRSCDSNGTKQVGQLSSSTNYDCETLYAYTRSCDNPFWSPQRTASGCISLYMYSTSQRDSATGGAKCTEESWPVTISRRTLTRERSYRSEIPTV